MNIIINDLKKFEDKNGKFFYFNLYLKIIFNFIELLLD